METKKLSLFFILAGLGLSLLSGTKALGADYLFQSQLDRFTVKVDQGSASFNGESVPSEPFSSIVPLFSQALLAECGSIKGKPDLTISRTINENTVKRIVYVEQGIISDGKNCSNISGSSLYTLPLHRNWFTGKSRMSVPLGDGFSVYRDKRMVVEFVRTENGYRSKDKKIFINWSFFDRFTEALKDFNIDFRVHSAAAKEETAFEIRQGSRIYKFVKVGQKTWAVQAPNSAWFAASGRFGIFEDMKPEMWISPLEKSLRVLRDETATLEVRKRALVNLRSNSSPDVKIAFQDILVEAHQPTDLRHDIVSYMRSRPTDDNFRSLVDSLRTTDDARLLNHITKTLRVRNPKGPVIEEDESASEYAAKINEWVTWRKTLRE